MNILKDNIFEFFFKNYNRLLFLYFLKNLVFFIIYNDGKSIVWRKKIIKDMRNLFRLKKVKNYTAIKDIKN